jgi:hypothetical protein
MICSILLILGMAFWCGCASMGEGLFLGWSDEAEAEDSGMAKEERPGTRAYYEKYIDGRYAAKDGNMLPLLSFKGRIAQVLNSRRILLVVPRSQIPGAARRNRPSSALPPLPPQYLRVIVTLTSTLGLRENQQINLSVIADGAYTYKTKSDRNSSTMGYVAAKPMTYAEYWATYEEQKKSADADRIVEIRHFPKGIPRPGPGPQNREQEGPPRAAGQPEKPSLDAPAATTPR